MDKTNVLHIQIHFISTCVRKGIAIQLLTMGSYRNNIGSIVTIQNVLEIRNNAGDVLVPAGGRVQSIRNNTGRICISENSAIAEIHNNAGRIAVRNGTTIGSIGNNAGEIILFGDCVIGNVRNDAGRIIRVPNPNPRPPPPEPPTENENNDAPPPAPTTGSNQCEICKERLINVAFQCGHVCCSQCSNDLTICHICGEPITTKINLRF